MLFDITPLTESNCAHQNAMTARATFARLRESWKYGEPLGDVRLPYAPILWELAALSNLKVTRTLFGGRIRLRGSHEEIKGVLDMFLATQLGSERIA
jgi:hypothetical protein